MNASAVSSAGETARFPSRSGREYAEAAEHYAGLGAELGGRFYDEIDRLIAEACTHPRAFRCVSGQIRCHISTAFPFGILFEDRPDMIRILTVMNLHRDPDYWKHRL